MRENPQLRYERAIAYLTEHPEKIDDAWRNPDDHRGGSLFLWCDDEDGSDSSAHREATSCGCLTQIRTKVREAITPELTAEIRADESIPAVFDPESIRLDELSTFMKWQIRLDEMFPDRYPVTADDKEYLPGEEE